MKFGLALFGLSPRHYCDVARRAEERGFESVWMPEHLVLPDQMPATYLYTESGLPPITPDTPLYDPWVVLGSVAGATRTLRLATNVFVLPLRHPMPTARSVVTLDRLSRGRVTLGVGVGWLEEEFIAADQEFHDRGTRTDEIIGILRRLWTEQTIEHHGRFYDFGPVRFEPKTLQSPNLPIEVGGSSPAALRRAGRIGDGWIEIGAGNLGNLAEMLEAVTFARKEAGRLDQPFEVTTSLGRDLDTVRRCADLGVSRVVVGPTPSTDVLRDPSQPHDRLTVETFNAWIDRYAEQVIAKS